VALGFAPAPKPARALMRLNVALNKPTNNKVDVWKSIDDAANLVPTILIAMASTVEPSMLLLLVSQLPIPTKSSRVLWKSPKVSELLNSAAESSNFCHGSWKGRKVSSKVHKGIRFILIYRVWLFDVYHSRLDSLLHSHSTQTNSGRSHSGPSKILLTPLLLHLVFPHRKNCANERLSMKRCVN
jgi:hypothetical protein